ncbi:hypothetical protein [Streptococcus pneumoniae]|nr:hypothetical protein [Streptococcus pneumoniae]CMY22687.1 Uncharacterised protein [Streptococcus pneumoniae]
MELTKSAQNTVLEVVDGTDEVCSKQGFEVVDKLTKSVTIPTVRRH